MRFLMGSIREGFKVSGFAILLFGMALLTSCGGKSGSSERDDEMIEACDEDVAIDCLTACEGESGTSERGDELIEASDKEMDVDAHETGYNPEDLSVDIETFTVNDVPFEMVCVEGGTFMMGWDDGGVL